MLLSSLTKLSTFVSTVSNGFLFASSMSAIAAKLKTAKELFRSNLKLIFFVKI